jgi:hypothetical protein
MEYQRKKNNKYVLPASVYNQTIWLIRDYQRMKDEAESLLTQSAAVNDGMPHGSPSPNGVVNRVIQRDKYLEKCKAIEEAFASIPPEYRQGVSDSILYRTRYPDNADRSTYARHKSRVIYLVAFKLGMITEVS